MDNPLTSLRNTFGFQDSRDVQEQAIGRRPALSVNPLPPLRHKAPVNLTELRG